jgi:lipopolysaccharide transport system permease protein
MEEPSVYRIQPSRGWVSLRLRELWEYRELLYQMTVRDLLLRYKQTVMGFGWAIFMPLVNTVAP